MVQIYKNTVIEVDDADHTSVEDWNYCTFNERFRNRFYQVQTARYGRKFKSSNEIYIGTVGRRTHLGYRAPRRPHERVGTLGPGQDYRMWLNVIKTCSRRRCYTRFLIL